MLDVISKLFFFFDDAAYRSGCEGGTPAEAAHVLPRTAMARNNVRQASQGTQWLLDGNVMEVLYWLSFVEKLVSGAPSLDSF